MTDFPATKAVSTTRASITEATILSKPTPPFLQKISISIADEIETLKSKNPNLGEEEKNPRSERERESTKNPS